MSLHCWSQASRCAVMSAGLTVNGCLGCTANLAHAEGSGVPLRTGKTYIEPGRARCTSRLSRKSTNASAPFTFRAPVSTPAYSTWRKQVSSRALVVDVLDPFGTVKAGEES